MASVNKVILIGNLGADPDIRYTSDSKPVVNLSVATSEKWKTRDGEPKERTEWHRVVVFGKLADIAANYLRKGSKVYLEGKLQTRKWQNRDGIDCYTTEVVLSGFNCALTLLDGKPRDDRGSGEEAALNAEAREAEQSAYDDEIPF